MTLLQVEILIGRIIWLSSALTIMRAVVAHGWPHARRWVRIATLIPVVPGMFLLIWPLVILDWINKPLSRSLLQWLYRWPLPLEVSPNTPSPDAGSGQQWMWVTWNDRHSRSTILNIYRDTGGGSREALNSEGDIEVVAPGHACPAAFTLPDALMVQVASFRTLIPLLIMANTLPVSLEAAREQIKRLNNELEKQKESIRVGRATWHL